MACLVCGDRTTEGSMKFTKKKVSSLLGHTEVIFTLVTTEDNPLQLVAAPFGVTLSGRSEVICETEHLQAFAKALSEVWAEHRRLIPRLTQNLQGH